jgi:hypothetical protein
MRLTARPPLDVSAEADLWFSQWVRIRGADGIVLLPAVRAHLQRQLADQLANPKDEQRKEWELIWDVIARVHASISPALLVEERVAWLVIRNGVDAITDVDEELRPALRALVVERREGVARWFERAWERLPKVAREASTTAWQLAQVFNNHTSGLPLPVSKVPSGLAAAHLAEITDALKDIRLGVRRDGPNLQVGDDVTGIGAVAILVPNTDPRLLELRSVGGADRAYETIAIHTDERAHIEVGRDTVLIRNARGFIYEIMPSTGPERSKADVSVIPYDPTQVALSHPGRADDFFMHGPTRTEAALCAEMSRLAYVNEIGLLEAYLTRGDFTLVEAIGHNQPGTQIFIATSSDAARPITVVAFRGAEPEDSADWLTDLRVNKVRWEGAGKVHQGFHNALPNMSSFAGSIPKSTRVLLTGHSLGAALATLAAVLYRPDSLYTFGSPRVGDQVFADKMRNIDHTRYANCCDQVPTLPPRQRGYVHVGRLYYIDRHGKIVFSPSQEVIDEDQRQAGKEYSRKYVLRRNTVITRRLADHAPINYLSAVMGLRS